MNLKEYSKYALSLLFILIVYLSYLIIKPFVLIVAGAMIIAYITYPLYKFLLKKTGKKQLSSILVIALIILVISIPAILVLNLLVEQAIDAYQFAKESLPLIQDSLFEGGVFKCDNGESANFMCSAYERVTKFIGKEQLGDAIRGNIANITSYISRSSYQTLKSLPTRILDIGIMFFLIFFFLIDAEKIFNACKIMLPMRLDHENYIIQRLKETTHAVVFGQITTAMIQGILGGIGFAVLGVPNALLFGIMMMFLALIPMVGTAIIWFPTSLYMILMGYTQGNYWSWIGPQHSVLGGVLLFLWGALIVSSIDNVIKPKLIGERAKLHTAVVFLGVFGGLQMFGFMGILLGPILLGIFVTFLDILEKEKHGKLKEEKK